MSEVSLDSLTTELGKYSCAVTRNEKAGKLSLYAKINTRSCEKGPCWRDSIALERITKNVGLTEPSFVNTTANFLFEFDMKDSYEESEADKILDYAKKLDSVKTRFNLYVKRTEMEIKDSIDSMYPDLIGSKI